MKKIFFFSIGIIISILSVCSCSKSKSIEKNTSNIDRDKDIINLRDLSKKHSEYLGVFFKDCVKDIKLIKSINNKHVNDFMISTLNNDKSLSLPEKQVIKYQFISKPTVNYTPKNKKSTLNKSTFQYF